MTASTEAAPSPVGRELHVLLPGDVETPTGGNVYDRRVVEELENAYGWRVRRTDLVGGWPLPDGAATAGLERALGAIPDGGSALIDGLVACGVPAVVGEAAQRLRIAVVVHLPLPDETGLSSELAAQLADREGRTLRAVARVVVTSGWTARRVQSYGVPPDRIHVAEPGTDLPPLDYRVRDSAAVPELLCVAAVTPRKDQLGLVRALGMVAELPWRCQLVGPLDRDPAYVRAVRAELAHIGLEDRVRLRGPLPPDEVTKAYDVADLLVLGSRTETFGMVITEALSHGLPVLTTDAGAAAQTLGRAPDGTVPGVVVPPADAAALAGAFRWFLCDPALRARLRSAAVARRTTLGSWSDTTQRVAAALASLATLGART